MTESYNGPHPKRTANAEATIEAAMRYPIEWQEGFDDGYGDLSTGVTYDEDLDSDRSVAYDLGRNAGDLERLRAALRAENMSYGEFAELQGLEAFIDPGDPELLEAAAVPEYDDSDVDYGDGTAMEVAHRGHGGASGSFASEGCTLCPSDEDGDPEPEGPDPDAAYDAARDEAHNLAVEDGKPDSWRDYMPGGVSWGRV